MKQSDIYHLIGPVFENKNKNKNPTLNFRDLVAQWESDGSYSWRGGLSVRGDIGRSHIEEALRTLREKQTNMHGFNAILVSYLRAEAKKEVNN